ncbi:hypothetical protein SRHO_G00114140 [Serrasalmus rhombeus]
MELGRKLAPSSYCGPQEGAAVSLLTVVSSQSGTGRASIHSLPRPLWCWPHWCQDSVSGSSPALRRKKERKV